MLVWMYAWVIISVLVSLPLLWLMFIRLSFKRKEEKCVIEGYPAYMIFASMVAVPIMNIATNLFFGYILLRISGIIR